MTYPSRPAEAVAFRELFTNPATLHANGGTVFGSPYVNGCLRLDGVSQYAQFSINSTSMTNCFTIVAEFVPRFDTDDDSTRYLFSTELAALHRIVKLNNAALNTLRVYMGGVLLAVIPEAAYAPYWLVDRVNCMVVTVESGNTSLWLNGEAMLVSDATVFPALAPAQLFIGALYNGSFNFYGDYNRFSVHRGLWSESDVLALQDKTLFAYQNSADIWADMATAIIDGSNDRTPDRSRRGKTILLGSGTGTGTPSFSDPGFLFNGSSDYMTLPTAPTGDFTIVTKRSEDIAAVIENDLTTRNKIATAGQFAGTLEFYGEWPFLLSPIQQADLEYRLRGIR